MSNDPIKAAFFAGARAFFSDNAEAAKWQEKALPQVYMDWKKPTAPALTAWACPTCGKTGEADILNQPLYCDSCMFNPEGGKWVEVNWIEKGADRD